MILESWLILLVFGLTLLAVYATFEDRRRLYVDELRSRLFEIRDKLWLDALDGQMPLSSDGHRTVRNAINRMIRKAEHISWWSLLLTHWALSRACKGASSMHGASESARDGLDSLSDSAAQRLEAAQIEVAALVGLYMVKSSITLNCVLRVANVVMRLTHSSSLSRLARALRDDIRGGARETMALPSPQTALQS